MKSGLLPTRWPGDDHPVLPEIARQLDSGQPLVQASHLAKAMDREKGEVVAACERLALAYVTGKADVRGGKVLDFKIIALTERGLRTTGLWSNEDAVADSLVALLTQAGEAARDEDDASALKKAARLMKSVPSNLLSDVAFALI